MPLIVLIIWIYNFELQMFGYYFCKMQITFDSNFGIDCPQSKFKVGENAAKRMTSLASWAANSILLSDEV